MNTEKINEYNIKQIRLAELETWFNNIYRETLEKCNRRIEMSLPMKDGSDPRQIRTALYNQAEANANEINSLRNFIVEIDKILSTDVPKKPSWLNLGYYNNTINS